MKQVYLSDIFFYESCDECPHFGKYESSIKAYETCKDCPNRKVE